MAKPREAGAKRSRALGQGPPPLQLRPYQVAAVRAVMRGIESPQSGLVQMPTGSGKTAVMAACSSIIRGHGGVAVCLSHRVELQQQAEAAGLVAMTIQSFYRLQDIPHVDVLLVDEAHMIPPEDFSQYRTVIKGLRLINPHLRVVGFTATPQRFPDIPLVGTLFSRLLFRVSERHLLERGWLTPLRFKACLPRIALAAARRAEDDYTKAELLAAEDPEVTEGVVHEVRAAQRNAVLVFASSIGHANTLADALGGVAITQDTPTRARKDELARFKAEGGILTSCEVLTVGFDAPNIDALVMVRPTMSQVLWKQMLGRGMRKHPSKTECLVLDFFGGPL